MINTRGIGAIHDFQKGEILLEEFRVDKILGIGGMGKVYLVRRVHDEAPFALKVLHETALRSPSAERRFFKELRTWIDLPHHPHLAMLCFIRTIEGRIGIFSEYLDGGTLSDRIENKGIRKLDLLLDLAIQSAWGLEAAHKFKVVHKDVKSSNMLLTREGILKITDFGLSKVIHTLLQEMSLVTQTETGRTTSRGMTIAFCSPEQFAGKKAGYASDVWSWGVTVLEMLTGGLRWQFGYKALDVLEQIRTGGLPGPTFKVPDELWELLRECFRENPKERLGSMRAVSSRLESVFRKSKKKEYPRFKPNIEEVTESIPLDRILITGGTWKDPEIALKRLYERLGRTVPEETQQASNDTGRSKQAQMVTDLEKYTEAERLCLELLVSDQSTELTYEYAYILYQKGTLQRGVNDPDGALVSYSTAEECLTQMVQSGSARAMELKMLIHESHSLLLITFRRIEDAAVHIRFGTELAESLLYQHGMKHVAMDLMSMASHRGLILMQSGKIQAGIDCYTQSIRTCHDMLKTDNDTKLMSLLAMNLTNLAFGYWSLGDLDRAEKIMDEGLSIRESLAQTVNSNNLWNDLAIQYSNFSNILNDRNKYSKSLEVLNKAADIEQRLIEGEGSVMNIEILSEIFLNMSLCLKMLNRLDEAISAIQRSRQLRDDLYLRHGISQMDLKIAECLNLEIRFHLHQNDVEAGSRLIPESNKIFARYNHADTSVFKSFDYFFSRLLGAELHHVLGEHDSARRIISEFKTDLIATAAEKANHNLGWLILRAEHKLGDIWTES